jgi:protein-tyrosine phosphatase
LHLVVLQLANGPEAHSMNVHDFSGNSSIFTSQFFNDFMKQVLFVCLGNICRSPSAEAVFNGLIAQNGLEQVVSCDSAGILSYHQGEGADRRMMQHARNRGYELTSISWPFNLQVDFDRFDYIVGMDEENIRDLKSLARNDNDRQKISMMTNYCVHTNYPFIPDPYYGGADGFELVLDILEDTCAGLLQHILKEES